MSRYSLASVVLILCSVPLTTYAQDQEESETLEEVKVIGRYLYTDQVMALKTPTPILDVPQSLSIVTADQMELQGFSSLGDIVDYTPGVNTSQGEGHRDAVVFRGVRSTADFFIDGVRDDVQYYRPLYNLEQVEILRGPNALLFGRGGTGGILNRVTKKGVLGENFTSYRMDVGTFGDFDIQFDRNFAGNTNSALRINAFFESLSNHRDFYEGNRLGFNPTTKFELSSDTSLDLSYEYVDHERFIDRGIPTGSDGRPVKNFKDIVFGDPELNKTTMDAHLLRAAMAHGFAENVKGYVSAFYGDYDKLYQNFYVSGYNQETTPDVVTLDGYVDATVRTNLILSGNLIGEISTGDVDHTAIVGIEFIDTSSDQDRYNAYWNTTSDDNEIFTASQPINLRGGRGVTSSGVPTTNSFTTDLNDDTRVGVNVFSLYVKDEIEVSERLDLILGVRYDSFDIEVRNVPGNETRNRKDNQISPRLGLVFKPQEEISLYGSYSESFLPRSGEQFANINGNNNRLDPNTFSNLETGVKWDFGQGLSFTAALFKIEQSSPQVADNDPSTLDVIDSKISGFEVQVQGQVTFNWFASVGYGTLDGEQVNRSGSTGLRPRELPENMFSLYNYVSVTESFGLGFGMTRQAESFINNGNTAVLPSYTRLDASAYYDITDKLRIQVNIENLTDQLYFPNSHSTHQATVGAPFNAQLSITGRL